MLGCCQTSDVAGLVCPVASEDEPQRGLHVSRAIGNAGCLTEARSADRVVEAAELVAVEDIEELHSEVGVDSFGEHGDGLGDVEVLALVEELADGKGFWCVAKGEVGRGCECG